MVDELNPAQVTQDPLSLAPEGEAAAPPVVAPPPAPVARQISEQDYQEFENLRQRWQQAEPALQEYERMRPVYQQLQEQQRIAQQDQEVLAKAAQYEALGVDPQAARQIAQDALAMIRQHRQEAERVKRMSYEQRAFEQRKATAIAHYSKEYGVPPDALKAFDDDAPMAAFAQVWKRASDAERNSQMALKGRVPAQNFESGVGGGGGNLSLDALLRKDSRNMTLKELADWDQQIEQARRVQR